MKLLRWIYLDAHRESGARRTRNRCPIGSRPQAGIHRFPIERLPLNDFRANGFYAAPRCSASHTAVDSLTPSSTERPQCAIQAAIPSGVPDR